jgi:phage terminase large subunit-like protein
VPQSVERMTAAVGSLYEAIMGGSLTHDGDPAFETQILNAVPRFSERGFTLEKKKSRGKIDAAIALALAYDQALRHVNEPPSVYEDRELVSV